MSGGHRDVGVHGGGGAGQIYVGGFIAASRSSVARGDLHRGGFVLVTRLVDHDLVSVPSAGRTDACGLLPDVKKCRCWGLYIAHAVPEALVVWITTTCAARFRLVARITDLGVLRTERSVPGTGVTAQQTYPE